MADRPALRVHPAVRDMRERLRSGLIGRRDFLATATRLGVGAVAAVAMAGGGHARGAASVPQAGAAGGAPKFGGTLRCSMNVKEVTDPATYDWSEKANVARHMIEPLVRISTDNIAEPYLAERWEASEDLKTWTFYLRPDVRWSNGDAFGADDVVFNVERWLDPMTGSANLSRFSALTTTVDTGRVDAQGRHIFSTSGTPGAVEKIDQHTVRFHLNQPDITLPESLADYTALIVHRDFAESGGDLAKNPVGTGAFLLKEIAVGEKALLVKRTDAPWWGGEVYLDRILYIDHGDDAAAQIAALVSDQVDTNLRTSVEQVDTVRAIPHLQLLEAMTASTGLARMKVTVEPFNDVRVRRAVQACVDHERWLELTYRGFGGVGEDHHVSPIHPEYAALPRLKQDYALAKRLLAEAGHGEGLRLSIDCSATPTFEQNAAKSLAEMCRPAGITVAINVLPGGTYWDRWLTTPFGFTSWAHRPLGVQALNLAYRSGAPWNETSYANPEFDRLLDEAGTILDPNERRSVMAKLEAILQGDAIIPQALWRAIFVVANKRVHNLQAHPAEEHHYNKVWLA
jgi:peptide/nickel transport system substrate-binding protein